MELDQSSSLVGMDFDNQESLQYEAAFRSLATMTVFITIVMSLVILIPKKTSQHCGIGSHYNISRDLWVMTSKWRNKKRSPTSKISGMEMAWKQIGYEIFQRQENIFRLFRRNFTRHHERVSDPGYLEAGE